MVERTEHPKCCGLTMQQFAIKAVYYCLACGRELDRCVFVDGVIVVKDGEVARG